MRAQSYIHPKLPDDLKGLSRRIFPDCPTVLGYPHHPQTSQSPEEEWVDTSLDVIQLIRSFDLERIYQHFEGWRLGEVTQAHLEFILSERPNPGISGKHFLVSYSHCVFLSL